MLLAQAAAAARDVLARGLADLGWTVEAVEAYRSVAVAPDADTLRRISTADAVTFTSSSTVTNLCRALGDQPLPPVVASIGPVTSATVRELGHTVHAEADEHTIDGLVQALVDHLGRPDPA